MIGWAKEVFYVFSYLILTASGPAVNATSGEIDPEKPNIVLVYGMGATPPVMLPLKSELEEAGFNVIIANIGWARGDIDKLAERLNKFLDKREKNLSERYGLKLADIEDKIIFFGHSMGGLVIVSMQAREQKLLGFQAVSAGTPYLGAPMAKIVFWNKAGSQMRPDSKWLAKLRKNMSESPKKTFQIRAESDELVPENSSVLEGYPHYVAPIIGHAALVFELDPEVLKQFFPGYTWPKPVTKVSAPRDSEVQSP